MTWLYLSRNKPQTHMLTRRICSTSISPIFTKNGLGYIQIEMSQKNLNMDEKKCFMSICPLFTKINRQTRLYYINRNATPKIKNFKNIIIYTYKEIQMDQHSTMNTSIHPYKVFRVPLRSGLQPMEMASRILRELEGVDNFLHYDRQLTEG